VRKEGKRESKGERDGEEKEYGKVEPPSRKNFDARDAD